MDSTLQSDRITRHLQAAVGTVFPAAVVEVRQADIIVYAKAVGQLDPANSDQPTQLDSTFDLASLTKLFVVSAFLQAVAAGMVDLDSAVSRVLPEFTGFRPIQPYPAPLAPGTFVTVSDSTQAVDASKITFRHLLTHTSGLPAWRPLYQTPREQIRALVLNTYFSYPPDETIVYSDLGLIILGWALEKIINQPLATCIATLSTHLPNPPAHYQPSRHHTIAPTEQCPWRGRRMHAEVHDENAWSLGGVAGHAGLFGTVSAVADLGQAWLTSVKGSEHFLPPHLAQAAVNEQAKKASLRRGLGWVLWSADPTSIIHPLSPQSFGHTGFTGTSLHVDPTHDLVIACLTNRVYFGRKNSQISAFRRNLHRLLLEEITQ